MLCLNPSPSSLDSFSFSCVGVSWVAEWRHSWPLLELQDTAAQQESALPDEETAREYCLRPEIAAPDPGPLFGDLISAGSRITVILRISCTSRWPIWYLGGPLSYYLCPRNLFSLNNPLPDYRAGLLDMGAPTESMRSLFTMKLDSFWSWLSPTTPCLRSIRR
jgi:hypothetical protein